MSSTRLPGKVLRSVLGRPLLSYELERLAQIRDDLAIVVATSTDSADDPIAELCSELDIAVHRGPERDVLLRYGQAAARFGADPVVRITADCPLIDPTESRKVIDRFEDGACDYASNTLERTYPRGLDTEIFSRTALEAALRGARAAYQREHVTPFLYESPDRFRLCSVRNDQDLGDLRWSVDTPEDFAFVESVIVRLYPRNPAFRMADVLRLLRDVPDLARLNAHVPQKSERETQHSDVSH